MEVSLTPEQKLAGQTYRDGYAKGAEALRNGWSLQHPPLPWAADWWKDFLRAAWTLGWDHGRAGEPRDSSAAYALAEEQA